MIETTVMNFVSAATGVDVYLEIPPDVSDVFITLEKTGSGKTNHLCESTMALKSYAPSMLGAAELNQLVKQAMERLIELDGITKVRLNSDYNYTDTASKRYRYQAVFDIYHYEEI